MITGATCLAFLIGSIAGVVGACVLLGGYLHAEATARRLVHQELRALRLDLAREKARSADQRAGAGPAAPTIPCIRIGDT